MKKIFLVLIIIAGKINAQPFVDIINVQYQNFPAKSESSINKKIFKTNQFTGNIFFPFDIGNKKMIVTGASFDRINFTSNTSIDSLKKEFNLGSYNLQLGLIAPLKNKKWKTLIIAAPRIATDFTNIDNNDFQLGGAFLFTYILKKNMMFKFGLFYNSEYFGPFFMPLAGIDWKINKKNHLYGVLPGAMNYEYKITPKLHTGLSYRCITASYRNNNMPGNFYYREGHKFWGHNQIKNFYNYYFTKNLMVYAEVGYTAYRVYKLYNGKNIVDLESSNINTMDNIYFSAGMAFRIRLDSEY